MAIIDCNNRPEFTIKEVRGDGYIYSAQFTEASSLSDLTEAYTANALDTVTPAIDEFGVEETVESLSVVYAELLNDVKINAYNNLILSGNTPENALSILDFSAVTVKVKDNVVISSEYRDSFFENQFPAIKERMTIGVINPVEFAEFARDVGYTSMQQVKNAARKDRFNLLKLLNFFLGGAALGQLLGGICSLLSNPFAGLTGIINSGLDAIEKAMSLKFGFLDIIEKAKKLLDVGKAIAKIKSFQELIGKSVEKLIDGVKRKTENLIASINEKISSVINGTAIKNITNFMQNKVRQVKNFFSEANMKNLVDKVKDSVGKFAAGFKNFTTKAADFILSSMCKISSTVQDFLEAPMKSLENAINTVKSEFNLLKNVSTTELRKAIEGGRAHITTKSKTELVDAWNNSRNTAIREQARKSAKNGTKTSGSDIVKPKQSKNNRSREYIYTPSKTTHPDPSSWKWLDCSSLLGKSFWDSSERIEMSDYGGGFVVPKETGISKDIGYYGIDLEVLERAEALGESLNRKLYILSGFRHKIYNQWLIHRSRKANGGKSGVAIGSKHMDGKALDVAQTPWSLHTEFVAQAYVHGFKGIGYYPSMKFVHIDMGPQRDWRG